MKDFFDSVLVALEYYGYLKIVSDIIIPSIFLVYFIKGVRQYKKNSQKRWE